MASKLTKAARMQECTANIHPHCNYNAETVVFCHAPSEDKGWGIKSPDWWGGDCCYDCHAALDDRITSDLSKLDKAEIWLRVIFRTQKRRIEQELIRV
jgi:hypothetical protein